MGTVTFRFLEPCSFIGRLITWRLRERFSHAAIVIGDYAYSSTFPLVAMVPTSHHTVSCQHRTCQDIEVEVTDDQLQGIQAWCESQLCKPYDFLSLLGWISGIHSWKSINSTYCFEFCRRPLTFLGLLPSSDSSKLITGHQLFQELAALAGQTVDLQNAQPQSKARGGIGNQSPVEDDQDGVFWLDVALGHYHDCHQHRSNRDVYEQEGQSQPL